MIAEHSRLLAIATLAYACKPTPVVPPSDPVEDPPPTSPAAAPAPGDAFRFTARGLGVGEASAWSSAWGEFCDHCGGGPQISFGAFSSLANGEELHVDVTVEGMCPLSRPIELDFSGFASLRRKSVSGEWTTERLHKGRVHVGTCQWDRGRLSARFELEFASGSLRGKVAGPVKQSAGYD